MTGLALLAGIAHQAAFGAVASVGFGVLFNFGKNSLVWAAGIGFVTLGVRTVALDAGWSLEAASFVAAFVAAAIAQVFHGRLRAAAHWVALAGAIPMVPGAFFSHALLGFFDLTVPQAEAAQATLLASLQAFLRVIFTLGAIGAGLTIPSHLLRRPEF